MGDWVLLLPPSETKGTPPPGAPKYDDVRAKSKCNSFSELDPYRNVVIDCLSSVIKRGVSLDRVFELSGDSLDSAVKLNSGLPSAPAIPARELYRGVMYDAISFSTLKAREKKLFDKNALILSGLYGVVRPSDCIAPYKLKISTNLGSTVGKLVQFWRRPVSEIIRQEVRGKIVWDFLPDQHRRVWDGTGEVTARHQVKFVKRVVRSGVAEYKTISHHSKALKGDLIRHLLAKNACKPKDLIDFVHPKGYRYRRDLSVTSKDGSLLVFAAD